MKKHTPCSSAFLRGRFPLTAVLLACAAGPLAAQSIPNPGFEADTFTEYPGYVSFNPQGITGWTGGPDASYGLNPSPSSPFADNGAVPQGTRVAFIQSQNSGTPTELGTTISGLTANGRYRLSFRVNARGGQTPRLTVDVGDTQLMQSDIWNVGGANPYRYVDLIFTADGTSMPLTLRNVAAGDTTVVVDDFSVTAAPAVTWNSEMWTDDASIGLNSAYVYTHAYNFNSSVSPEVSGVAFTGIGGGNPAVANSFSMTAYNGVFSGDNDEKTITGDGAQLASDFVYNGNPGALALQGLKPSTKYVLNLYSVGFDNANYVRWITFGLGNERLSVDQNAFGNNTGNRVSLNYTSDADGKATINLMPLNNATFHLYGFSNREAALPPASEAPLITIQPAGVRVLAGETATLVGGASGTPAPSYQWSFNGVELSDTATYTGTQTAALTVTGATAAQAGFYTVKATNNLGNVTSRGGYLEVVEPRTGPLFSTGVDAAGNALPIQDEEGNPLSPVTDPHYVLKINPDGDPDISAIVETPIPSPPWIANTALSQWVGPKVSTVSSAVGLYTYRTILNVTNPETFTVSGYYAVDNLADSIRVNGQPVSGVTLSQGFMDYTWFSINKGNAPSLHAGANELDFVVNNIQDVGYTGLRVFSLGVPAGIKPVVLDQPQGGTFASGQPVTLSARVYGSSDLTYQWTFNGNPIAGAVYSSHTIGSFAPANAGTYAVTATNSLGSAVSGNAVLAITDVPPSVLTHPQGLLAAVGESFTLSVASSGSAPLTYEWSKNGTVISSATGATYTVSSAALSDTGTYSVKISNAYGNVTSNPASVTVLTPIPGLYNSGVDDTGAVLADGSADSHYTLIFNADGDNDIPAIVHNSTVLNGNWVSATATSKWISPRENSVAAGAMTHDGGAGPGTYVYRTTFNLSGFDPASVQISGTWTSDNPGLAIRVNETATGITNGGNFNALNAFTINDGNADFVDGVNTLDFVVQNVDAETGYTGLRVEGLKLLGTALPAANLPPVTITLSAGGKPVISFPGTPGITYPVQRSTTLSPANSWSVIGQPIAPAGGQVQFEDPAPPVGRAFYRVVVPQ